MAPSPRTPTVRLPRPEQAQRRWVESIRHASAVGVSHNGGPHPFSWARLRGEEPLERVTDCLDLVGLGSAECASGYADHQSYREWDAAAQPECPDHSIVRGGEVANGDTRWHDQPDQDLGKRQHYPLLDSEPAEDSRDYAVTHELALVFVDQLGEVALTVRHLLSLAGGGLAPLRRVVQPHR